ncbi:putative acetyltransferase [gamma proteobacterium IMCC1989]|nr:putative acetyltransferase [gamma proteobacterium IMCC1989]
MLAPKASTRAPNIDILRIISMLIVLLFHYNITHGAYLTGTHGVVIFFMISGYCMHFSIGKRTACQFLSARFWRLIPMLFICATISTIVEIYFSEVNPDRLHGFKDYVATLICMPTGNIACDIVYAVRRGEPISYGMVDGVYWSLLVEIRFYLLLLLIVFIFKIKKPYLLISLLGLFSFTEISIPLLSKGHDFILYLPFFGFGMSLKAWIDGDRYGVLGIILSLSGFLLSAYLGTKGISMGFNMDNIVSYGSCFLIFTLILYIVPYFQSRLISYLGIITYPIYLLHQDIGLISIKLLQFITSTPLSLLITIAIILLLSIIAQSIDDNVIKRFRQYFTTIILRQKHD